MKDVTRILSALEQGDPHAAEQLLPLVYEELRQLPERQRRAVELRHLKGLAIAEVAAELNCSRSTVVGLLNRGVKGLRGLLEVCGP
jgi:RNA polymerase sigma factor (sigma-70 family)